MSLPILPLSTLAVACALLGVAYSDVKVKSPSALLMCLLFTLAVGIGYWIHSTHNWD